MVPSNHCATTGTPGLKLLITTIVDGQALVVLTMALRHSLGKSPRNFGKKENIFYSHVLKITWGIWGHRVKYWVERVGEHGVWGSAFIGVEGGDQESHRVTPNL